PTSGIAPAAMAGEGAGMSMATPLIRTSADNSRFISWEPCGTIAPSAKRGAGQTVSRPQYVNRGPGPSRRGRSRRRLGSRVGGRLLSTCFLYDLLLLRSEYASILVTVDAGTTRRG